MIGRLASLAAGGFAFLALVGCAAPDGSDEGGPPIRVTTFETPASAPPFALTDQAGRRVALDGLRGRVVLMTFLYTRCPDVCSLMAATLNTALRAFEAGDPVSVLAVSVDPQGDTPAAVDDYVDRLGLLPGFRYLTGTPTELAAVWKAYGIAAQQRLDAPITEHTAATYLIDARGARRALYRDDAPADLIVRDVRALLREDGVVRAGGGQVR